MGTAVVQYGFPYADGDISSARQKRLQCEQQRSYMETERASFISLWQDLGAFILPRRPRFFVSDVNKGDRRTQKIIDSTATLAARTMSSGLMSGITNPARPWFQIAVANKAVADQPDVKEWCYEVRNYLLDVFAKSNLYDILPTLYSDCGVFATGAFLLMEDEQDIIRCYDLPLGSYCVANDDRLEVRTFCRLFRLSVQQVVQKWGQIDRVTGKPDFESGRPTTISVTVQNLWKSNNRQAWIDIVHMIQPNYSYDGKRIESRYKAFESVYYEYGTWGQKTADPSMTGLLAHEGFDEWPVMCARWEKNSEDVYGTNSPGITALGDVKQLQSVEKKFAMAIEKMLNPPLTGPSSLKSASVSLLPGGVTYNDVTQGNLGLRPIHEVNFGTAIGPTMEWQQETRNRIQSAFFVPQILAMTEGDQHDMTAREVEEIHDEKLIAFGPLLFRMNVDVFDPTITRTFNIAMRRGLIPPAPEALQGQQLSIEYVSIMHQAQEQIGLVALERAMSFAGQVAQVDPSAMDNVDTDEVVRQYFDAAGTEPKIIRDPEQVAQVRQARQQAQAQQQAAENAPKVGAAARDLSEAQAGGGESVLQRLLNSQNARRTIGATANPPASVAG